MERFYEDLNSESESEDYLIYLINQLQAQPRMQPALSQGTQTYDIQESEAQSHEGNEQSHLPTLSTL